MAFDDLTDIYEAMIDWPKRLGNETPFFRRWFDEAGARRVADVACGTGRHAAMFHAWGLDVHASDISPNMVRRATASFGEHPSLRWSVQGFDQPPGPDGSFDAVVCLGNSLALAGDKPAAFTALASMLRAVRAGGVVIVHVLNLWKLPDGPSTWQKMLRQHIAGQDVLILKGVHRSGDRGFVELVLADDSPKIVRSESVPFLGLSEADLEKAARASGAAEIRFFGNHRDEPYNAAESADLIMVATKG